MSKKWPWVAIGLVLVVLAPGAADVVYSDGYVPPRSVDGVWVSSGVSDEVAKAEAARLECEKAAKRQWLQWQRQWYTPDAGSWMLGGPAMAIGSVLDLPYAGNRDVLWQRLWREPIQPNEVSRGLGTSPGLSVMPGRYIPPYTHRDSAMPGPRIDGMDIESWGRRMENNFRWQTGQNQYPPWVFTGR